MVSKRFLKMAERMRSPEPPEPRKPSQKLEQLLQRDETGKPIVKLTPIERTAVNTPTQEDYWNLMRVYECGSWRWISEESPTQRSNWNKYEEKTCVGGADIVHFGFGNREYYLQEKVWNVISPQEFYDAQNITPEMLQEINIWFDENGK